MTKSSSPARGRSFGTPFIVASCLGFLAGIALASFAYAASYVPRGTFVATATALFAAAAWQFGHRRRVVVCCAIIAAGIGVMRFTAVADGAARIPRLPDGAIELQGEVRAVTSLSQGRSRVRLVRAEIPAAGGVRDDPVTSFRRSIAVFLPPMRNAVAYGDTVRVRCRYAPPERSGDRLTIDGTCAVQTVNNLQLLATGGGSPTLRALDMLRRDAARRFTAHLPEPGSGILRAMVLGIPHAVTPELEEAFRRSGTIHILVVSGWHMSFIALLIRRALLRIGIHRRTSAKLSIAMIAAYAAMVGLTAPAVRGALVAIALLAVDLLGRVANPLRILLLVATAMVAVHPHILGFDLAFQLTVVATAAILLASPIAEYVLPCRRRMLGEFRDLFAASIAASLATAPLIGSAFGVVSVVGPLIGILVLPTAAAIVAGGIVLLAIAFALPSLVPAAAWTIAALTDATAWAVARAAAVPWAQLPSYRFDHWFIAGVYLLGLLAVLRWYRRQRIPILSPFAFSRRGDR